MRRKTELNGGKDFFSHWLWALPILLLVAFLSIRQIDRYPPNTDELHSSMSNAGWLEQRPYSLLEVIENVHRRHPEHLPGYYILLYLWGMLSPHDIATGKVLSIFLGLLSVAVAVRLGRDFVAPPAGLFAAVIVASCAFYNFYLAHLRMYTLLVMSSGMFLWLYLRIMHQPCETRLRDFVALFAAAVLMISAQVTSILLVLTIGIYHLFLPKKNPRWRRVAVVLAAGVLVFLPFSPAMATQGVTDTLAMWGGAAANAREAIQLWLIIITNNQFSLLFLASAGLALGVWRRKIVLHRSLMLPAHILDLLCSICRV